MSQGHDATATNQMVLGSGRTEHLFGVGSRRLFALVERGQVRIEGLQMNGVLRIGMIACCLVVGPLAGAFLGGIIAGAFEALIPGILAGACVGLAIGIIFVVYFSRRLADAQDQRGVGGIERGGSEGGSSSEGGSFLYFQDGGGGDGGGGDGGGD